MTTPLEHPTQTFLTERERALVGEDSFKDLGQGRWYFHKLLLRCPLPGCPFTENYKTHGLLLRHIKKAHVDTVKQIAYNPRGPPRSITALQKSDYYREYNKTEKGQARREKQKEKQRQKTVDKLTSQGVSASDIVRRWESVEHCEKVSPAVLSLLYSQLPASVIHVLESHGHHLPAIPRQTRTGRGHNQLPTIPKLAIITRMMNTAAAFDDFIRPCFRECEVPTPDASFDGDLYEYIPDPAIALAYNDANATTGPGIRISGILLANMSTQ